MDTATKVYEPLRLPCGRVLKNRFVLSPMVTNSSTKDGFITQADLDYALRRADSAGLQITGAAHVHEFGQLFEFGFTSATDEAIPGLKKLATAMQSKGATAILQLTHAGRFATATLMKHGYVYGPSPMQLHAPKPHDVHELNTQQLEELVEAYANATRRAIAAGFDGVEISSAQRLLIQTFFSTFSNERRDTYGCQSLESRAKFGLDVLRAVQKVIDEEAPEGFVLGFRATPEETRGSQIGYSIKEFIQFMEWALEIARIDYLAIASWGHDVFRNRVRGAGAYQGQLETEVIWKHFQGRMAIMASGGINSPDKVREALAYCDFVGSSTPLVVDPEFLQKMQEDKEDTINFKIKREDLKSLAIPEASFKDIVPLMDYGESLPKDARDLFRSLEKNYSV